MAKLDLSKLTNSDLIDELQSRGYYTNLLYCVDDVNMQLEYMNEDRADDEQITLTEEQKLEVLDISFNADWYCERMNIDLQNEISNIK